MPMLNVDVCYSAFICPGPALEVIHKILDRGSGASTRGRGGYLGGGRRTEEISDLEPHELMIVKNKLRGAKVSFLEHDRS